MHSDATIRIAVIEDNRAKLEHLSQLINNPPGMTCCGAYDDVEKALKNIARDKPNVIILDLWMPEFSDGLSCLKELHQRLPDTPILAWTVEQDSRKLFRVLEAGAAGYLLKGTSPPKMLEDIEEASRGGSPMSPSIARHVLKFFHERGKSKRHLEALTRRENEVLELLAEGKRKDQVANELGITKDTVSAHLRNIYKKLQAHSLMEALIKFKKFASSTTAST